MTESDTIWRLETGFWLNGRDHYDRHLATSARMVFPDPAGILANDRIIAGIEGAPRWQSVDFDAQVETRLGDTVVIAYRATGHRNDRAPYRALCSSTYVRDGGEWKLLMHQQTPLD
jgi:hypothetical protein